MNASNFLSENTYVHLYTGTIYESTVSWDKRGILELKLPSSVQCSTVHNLKKDQNLYRLFCWPKQAVTFIAHFDQEAKGIMIVPSKILLKPSKSVQIEDTLNVNKYMIALCFQWTPLVVNIQEYLVQKFLLSNVYF